LASTDGNDHGHHHSATGTVTFYSGTTSLGTGTLSSGVATLTTTSLTNTTTADITYSLTAAYGGDSTYEASTSDALSITVTPLGTTANQTSLSISPSAPTTADDVTLTATVSAAAATGTVTFYDGNLYHRLRFERWVAHVEGLVWRRRHL
jgi:hypothetical protein